MIFNNNKSIHPILLFFFQFYMVSKQESLFNFLDINLVYHLRTSKFQNRESR